MMFVNDTPSSIVLTEPHREAELEVGLLAIALDVDAMPDSRCKGHIVSGGDLYILKVEHNRFCGRGEESLPSLSAVSEAPTSEDLSFRCAVKGRFRYSDLKEAAPGDYGISIWMSRF